MTATERATERAIAEATAEATATIAAEGIRGYAFTVEDVHPVTEMVTIKSVCLDCGAEDTDQTDMDVRDYIAATAAGHDRVCDAKDGAE